MKPVASAGLRACSVRTLYRRVRRVAANTAVTWPGRLRQIHSYFRNRSPDQMLDTAAPWTSHRRGPARYQGQGE
ncbi:MAG: hypothetical protein ACRDNF_02880 [Streptosporangiaceae bacterium]